MMSYYFDRELIDFFIFLLFIVIIIFMNCGFEKYID